MPNVTVTCPSCGLSREVSTERIPASVVQVTCPTCRHSFRLSLEPTQLTSAEIAPEKAPDAQLPGLPEQSLQQGGRRSRGLLLFFVLLIVSLAGVRIWAEGKQRAVASPNFLAASETGVAVAWGDEVMLFGQNGQLTGRQPLPRGAVLTQLFFVGNELWHADVTSNAIRRLRNGAWETVVNGGPRFRGAFKVAVDTVGGEIFVTDSSNHAIHHFRSDGTYVRSFGREGKGQGELKFPNTLLLDRDGNLIVVNTNCLRIDLFSRDGRFLRTLVTADAVGPHKYPTLMARTGDRFVFLHTADLRRAVVMVYAEDGRAVGQLPLPVPLEDAGDVAAFGSTVLVSDIGHRQVHRFDAATLDYTGPFSPAIVQRAAEARQTEMSYADLSRYALAALLICCLPVFYLYYQTRQREVNRLAKVKVNTGTVVPEEALLGTLVDRQKLALATALAVAWVLVKLYATSLIRENHTLMPFFLLVHTCLSIATIRIFMESGITSPSRRETLAKMVRASLTSLSKLLSDGERVVLCTAFRKGTHTGRPSLLLLTDRRILIVDFSNLHPTRFWQFGYGDIFDVVQEEASSRIAAIGRFLKIDQRFITLSLRPGAGTDRLNLYGVGGTVSDRVAQTLAELRNGPSLGYRKLCATCFTPLEASGCPRCQRKGDWKPLLLSLLYPGMGQFYNREIFKGTVFSVLFTVGGLSLTRPLTHIIARSTELSPDSVPYLTNSVLTLVSIYLFALLDADLVGRQGKRLFSKQFFWRR